jgi:hypothetical protein
MGSLAELADSVLPIIVLVVIAGARILMMVRRHTRNRSRDQTDLPGPVLHTVRVSPEILDDEFSAWNLPVNDYDPAPAKPVELPASSAQPGPPPKARLQSPVQPEPLKNRIRQTSVCSLPPLQQGVVWAEILGTPKGL